MNPAAGILVLLAALWLLLAFFDGRLEWLFQLGATASGATATTTSAQTGVPPRPTTTGGQIPVAA